MAIIASATFISQSGKSKQLMKKMFVSKASPMIVIKELLLEANRQAKITDQYSYVKGSYTTECSTKEWIAYLRERI